MLKKYSIFLALCLALSIVAAPVLHAAPVNDLKLEIQPIECSIDRLNSGINTLTQVSPGCTQILPQTLPFVPSLLFDQPIPTGFDSIPQSSTAPHSDASETPTPQADGVVTVLAIVVIVATAVTLVVQTSAGSSVVRRVIQILRRG